MYFHSILSVFFFLPIFFLIFYIGKRFFNKKILFVILFFSFLFYGFDYPFFLIPLLISSISDYFISRHLIKIQEKRIRKIFLILSIFINISLLTYFKYSYFLISNFNYIFNTNYSNIFTENIIIPAGISFYTFQTLSFTIDCFRKKLKKMPSFFDYLLYVSYFPQLVAGPILRPNDFFDSSLKPLLKSSSPRLKSGLTRFAVGLALKLLAADELARLNDIAFNSPYTLLSSIDVWTMAFGFGLQIYFDFSAYSHMAIGISEILGLKIKENFNFPYLSKSVTEFWRRWHISLSSWVLDYLYKYFKDRLPSLFLGIFPLLITWSIMGLWHGSTWLFIFWGTLNGLLILFHRFYKIYLEKQIDKYLYINPTILQVIYITITQLSIMSTWIIFRSENTKQCFNLIQKIFNLTNYDLNLSFSPNYYLFVALFFISTTLFGFLNLNEKVKTFLRKDFVRIILISFSLAISLIFINRQITFIYFQF